MKFIKTIIVVSLAVGFHSCRPEKVTTDTAVETATSTPNEGIIKVTNQQFISSDYKLDTIKIQSFQKALQVYGKAHLPAKNIAAVSTLMPGTVEAFSVIEGQWVDKGRHLFNVLNPDLIDMQQKYLQLQNKATYLQSEYNRLQELVAEQIVTQREFAQLELDIKTNKTAVNALSQKFQLYGINPSIITPERLINHLAIQAPISGYISDIAITQGNYIDATTSSMTIQGLHHIHAELAVLERNAVHIRKDQKIIIKTPNGQQINGTVFLINPMINEDRTVNVHCHILPEDRKYLKPGMSLQGEISLNQYQSFALAKDAIVSQDGSSAILILVYEDAEEKHFQLKNIEIGMSTETHVEIVDATHILSTPILVSGAYYLSQ